MQRVDGSHRQATAKRGHSSCGKTFRKAVVRRWESIADVACQIESKHAYLGELSFPMRAATRFESAVPFPPHLMFYAPYLTNADLGLDGTLGPDGNPVGPAFVAGEGSPQALIIVPVGAHQSAGHSTAQ